MEAEFSSEENTPEKHLRHCASVRPQPLCISFLGPLLSPDTVYSREKTLLSSSAIALYGIVFHTAPRSCHCMLSALQTASKAATSWSLRTCSRVAMSLDRDRLYACNPLSHLVTRVQPCSLAGLNPLC